MSEKKDEFEALDVDDPAIARARSVRKLSGGEDKSANRRVLSNLTNEGQVWRLSAMTLIADAMPSYLGFLKDGAERELELRASLPRLKGRRGRDDVVDVVREPSGEAGVNVFSKLRNFISR